MEEGFGRYIYSNLLYNLGTLLLLPKGLLGGKGKIKFKADSLLLFIHKPRPDILRVRMNRPFVF
ncbi:hypothetical protein [Ammoniphilus sp. 3BR4]|uniref:hypothetical protein n=1 Tax=Ammoniphilus sp. 3BR4 TaxID=3158265 RepID=UPI003465B164